MTALGAKTKSAQIFARYAPHFLIDLSRKIEQYERQKPRSLVPAGMNRRIFEQN